MRRELGLGRADGVESVEIRWPSGGPAERFTDLRPDAAYVLREGSGQAEEIDLPTIDWNELFP